ncbi:hypothetical protein Shal_2470 [Shewanella halifaxensis HAW-EB4]|uniref:Uncharacterized protein n=1 Tax=Shewanella halifaxensis (strain HAW-EB4) TaxID=458817 RepID=B0TJN2_SHEHH|nr:hypothetical protein [Shewanella halifaxensis]ABZ77028.1 hypothetical protein Shal_2470 [Shewanella halifaxensis HAW-EB4]
MKQGDFISAKVYLNKFIENRHYYHKAYYDMAKIHVKLGEHLAAKKSLDLALSYSEKNEHIPLYQAKLHWLSSQQGIACTFFSMVSLFSASIINKWLQNHCHLFSARG